MGLKNYKKTEEIEVVYQASGAATGIVVTMDVYDETGVKDVAKSGAMDEIEATGRYKKAFTPDAEGGWVVLISDTNGGKSAGSFSVGAHNIESLGAAVASNDEKVVTMDGKVDIVDGKVDILTTKVNSILAPPMIC